MFVWFPETTEHQGNPMQQGRYGCVEGKLQIHETLHSEIPWHAAHHSHKPPIRKSSSSDNVQHAWLSLCSAWLLLQSGCVTIAFFFAKARTEHLTCLVFLLCIEAAPGACLEIEY